MGQKWAETFQKLPTKGIKWVRNAKKCFLKKTKLGKNGLEFAKVDQKWEAIGQKWANMVKKSPRSLENGL